MATKLIVNGGMVDWEQATHGYADASTLGLKPGEVPEEIQVLDPSSRVAATYRLAHTVGSREDTARWDYVQVGGGATLHVWND